MISIETEDEEKLRQIFNRFNRFMLLMWRLGLGPWINCCPAVFGRIMVITHTGRKTKLKRYTPLNYTVVEGEVYCLAALGPTSDWYRNIVADPNVEVWLPDGWWAGLATDDTTVETRLSILRQVLIDSGFAAPFFGLHPHQMTDAELDAATKDYRLLYIRRTTPRSTPGDMAWVWPLVTMTLLLLLFRQKRKPA